MIDLSPGQLRKAVDAYDRARCASHGKTVEQEGMSETNKATITPMIEAAIRAVLETPN